MTSKPTNQETLAGARQDGDVTDPAGFTATGQHPDQRHPATSVSEDDDSGEAITAAARRMVAIQGMDWAELDGSDIGYWESLAAEALDTGSARSPIAAPDDAGEIERLREATETARRLYRGLEMQAEIMRDRRRTGGWNGAENVARAFERQAEKARELHTFLSSLANQQEKKS